MILLSSLSCKKALFFIVSVLFVSFILLLFRELSARQKVELLFDMCNWRLELEDAMELTKVLISSIICFLSRAMKLQKLHEM